MAGDGRIQIGGGGDARAVQHILHQLLPVDGQGDGLTDPHIVHGRHIQVQAEEAGAQGVIGGNLVAVGVLILAQLGGGQVAGVDVAVLIGQQLGGGVAVVDDVNLVQLHLAAVVVLVLDQNGLGVGVVALELIGAGAHQIGVDAPAVPGLRAGVLGEDVGVAGAQVLDEGGEGVLQGDGEVVVVLDLNAGQLGGFTVQHVLGAHDHVEVAEALGAGGGSEHPLEGKFHVPGGELGAVGELHALLQLKAVHGAVLADGGEIGEEHHLLVVVVVKAQQAFGDLVGDGGGGAAGADLHIQRVAVGGLTEAEHLAAVGAGALAGFGGGTGGGGTVGIPIAAARQQQGQGKRRREGTEQIAFLFHS